MAQIFYRLRQNNNDKMPQSYGKWYAEMKHGETLNTRKLANHISEHGSIYTSDVVLGVLEKFRKCITEMLLEGKKVKLDGLGTFYTTIEGTGVTDPEKFSLQKNVEALHIRFLPERDQEMNICGPEFVKKAHFVNFDAQTAGLTGTYYEADENGSGTSNGDSGGGNGGSGSDPIEDRP